MPVRVRAVTLNLAGLGKAWFAGRRDAAVAGLRKLDPDLLLVQETTVRGRPDPYDQALDLGEALGLGHVAFTSYGNPEEAGSDERGGVAIASRWHLAHAEGRRLPPGPCTPDERSALLVAVHVDHAPLHVVTTHLSWRPDEVTLREAQVRALLSDLSGRGWLLAGSRLLFAGDLNAVPDEPAVAAVAEVLDEATDPARAPTWRSENPYAGGYPAPDRRLDHAFVTRGARVLRAEVVLSDPPVSDHDGILVEVEFP